jgi:hypothetical protein
MSTSPPVALTLFVIKGDPATLLAREEVQVVLTSMPDSTTIQVRGIEDEPRETLPGLPPVLRVQIGSDQPQWLAKIERRSLRRRLMDLGVLLRD